MNWKRYPIRAVKYVVYFYIFFIVLYFFIHLLSGNSLGTMPDFSGLFSARLLIGLTLLGVCYPFFGFSTSSVPLPEGGWEKHERDLRELMAVCGYKQVKMQDGAIVFRAISPARRVLTMFEDDIALKIENGNYLSISGLRKDVARIRLKVGDYARRIS